ncbi:MAG: capsular polysaccharide synthesis protein [Bacteroidales bacterium]|nr:capsular polysaccharide synthesis protein [Clostridium sp.]MCM1204364.1 capsular polysaccharide synthesis protein [Bacteroidales bacterium]
MPKILIWGTGSGAVKYMTAASELFEYVKILGFIDGKKQDDTEEFFIPPNGEKKKKITPEQISQYDYDYIVVLSSYYKEIKECAVKHGVMQSSIFKDVEFYRLWVDKGYLEFKHKYGSWIKEKKAFVLCKEYSSYVWVSWLQGYEEAPELVRACIDSIRQHSEGLNFVFITLENYQRYVEIPDYIISKFEQGIISRTFFSDILRLSLLEKYGGLWVDASVFCLGEFRWIYEKSDFFAFRVNDGGAKIAASWFLYSVKGHILIVETLRLLKMYCKEMNRMEHYYILHFFFRMVAECYDEEWKRVPRYNVENCYLLDIMRSKGKCLTNQVEEICLKMPIQKLNRRRLYPKDEDEER